MLNIRPSEQDFGVLLWLQVAMTVIVTLIFLLVLLVNSRFLFALLV
jgi:hypothetical protein